MTDRLLRPYTRQQFKSILSNWSYYANCKSELGQVAGLELWNASFPLPMDALTFAGAVSLTVSNRTTEVLNAAVTTTLATVGVLFMILVPLGTLLQSYLVVAIYLTVLLYLFFHVFKQWMNYRRGTS